MQGHIPSEDMGEGSEGRDPLRLRIPNPDYS